MTRTADLYDDIRERELADSRPTFQKETANQETGLSLELQSLKAIDKSGIKERVDSVITGIREGWVDAVDALALIKKGKEFFTLAEKNIRPYAEGKQLPKGFARFGVQFVGTTAGDKADYSTCGDPVWDELNKQAEELEAKKKKRETFLSGLTEPTDIVVNEAEVVTLKPLQKTGKLGYKLTVQ